MTTPTNPLDLAVQQLKAAEEAKIAAEKAIEVARLAAAEAAEEEILVIKKGMKARQNAFNKMVKTHQDEIAELDKKVQQLNDLLQEEEASPTSTTAPSTTVSESTDSEEDEVESVEDGYDWKAVMAVIVIVLGGLYLLLS